MELNDPNAVSLNVNYLPICSPRHVEEEEREVCLFAVARALRWGKDIQELQGRMMVFLVTGLHMEPRLRWNTFKGPSSLLGDRKKRSLVRDLSGGRVES